MELNKYSVKNKRLNDGKRTDIQSPLDYDSFNLQFAEVFDKQHYKPGLRKKDMVVIDCGANMGLTSLYFKDWAKAVYAIEPSELHYKALVSNTSPYPNIKTFNQGILSHSGRGLLKSNDEGTIPESFFGNGDKYNVVKVDTLKEFMQKNGIDHVDLLKIDVEGSEYAIFPSLGFESIADKIDFIVGEAHFVVSGSYPLIPNLVPEILKKYGFTTKFRRINNSSVTVELIDRERGSMVKTSVLQQTLFYAQKTSN